MTRYRYGMARPKTKSDAIAIRLSLPAYEAAQVRASAAGLSVREWAEQAMENALAPRDPSTPSEATKLARSQVEPRFKP